MNPDLTHRHPHLPRASDVGLASSLRLVALGEELGGEDVRGKRRAGRTDATILRGAHGNSPPVCARVRVSSYSLGPAFSGTRRIRSGRMSSLERTTNGYDDSAESYTKVRRKSKPDARRDPMRAISLSI